MTDLDLWKLHKAACDRGDSIYTDPETSYSVFTRNGLLERGKCCGAGCRHCPYGHANVDVARRASQIQQPAWLNEIQSDCSREIAILFWSGGKDSFLAYKALEREQRFQVVLLTTFDARSRMIAHQELPIDSVVEQAQALGAALIGVPMYSGVDYVEQVIPALELTPDCQALCFGDLHLEHIRSWREESFAANERTAQMRLYFPLWKADYGKLLDELIASGARCEISAVAVNLPSISIGDHFDINLIARLPEGIDPFGENGEFHTRIVL